MSFNFGRDPRENTNKLLAMVDEGLIDKDVVLRMALEWTSDADVEEMCRRNDVFLDEDDDE